MRIRTWILDVTVCISLASGQVCAAVETSESPAVRLYRALQEFALSGDTSRAENLTLKRDRVAMTFTGTFYFESPIQNRVYGVVFVGEGTFHADPPPTDRWSHSYVLAVTDARKVIW